MCGKVLAFPQSMVCVCVWGGYPSRRGSWEAAVSVPSLAGAARCCRVQRLMGTEAAEVPKDSERTSGVSGGTLRDSGPKQPTPSY